MVPALRLKPLARPAGRAGASPLWLQLSLICSRWGSSAAIRALRATRASLCCASVSQVSAMVASMLLCSGSPARLAKPRHSAARRWYSEALRIPVPKVWNLTPQLRISSANRLWRMVGLTTYSTIVSARHTPGRTIRRKSTCCHFSSPSARPALQHKSDVYMPARQMCIHSAKRITRRLSLRRSEAFRRSSLA